MILYRVHKKNAKPEAFSNGFNARFAHFFVRAASQTFANLQFPGAQLNSSANFRAD
jgi:predicted component of type VI protein secretion system